MERVSPRGAEARPGSGSASAERGTVSHRQIERSFLRLSGVGSGAVGAGDIFYVCQYYASARVVAKDMRTPSYSHFYTECCFWRYPSL